MRKERAIYIIAEISANHGQDYGRAVNMIKAAKECGADAVKFQCYTPDTLTIDVNNKYFRIKHPRWGGQTLYDLYKKAYTPLGWFKGLKKTADKNGLAFFATAFDKSSVDFLEELGVFCHKIASFELVDIPLIEYAAKTGKPMILSTGMASLEEIKEAVGAAKRAGSMGITLLKCVSSYPARAGDMNLLTIPDLKKNFKCRIGISDHSLGIGVSIAAAAIGAEVIERHFTISRKFKTPDSFFSLELGEFKTLVDNVRIVEKAMGGIHYGLTEDEKKSRVFRRSLFAVEDIKQGEYLTEKNVRSIRPSYGMSPKFLRVVLGKRAKVSIKRGTPLAGSLFK